MGWLFAVGLGLHRGTRVVVVASLLPIVVGHAAAVAIALLAALAFGAVIDEAVVARSAGIVLVAWAVWHLAYGHRRRVRIGMQAGLVALGLWSFLMASAHGAGLMVVPFMLHSAAEPHAHAAHPITAGVGFAQLTPLNSMLLHTASYLFVTGVVAVVVYEKAGLRLLRSTWINLDIIWTAALMLTAVLTLTL